MGAVRRHLGDEPIERLEPAVLRRCEYRGQLAAMNPVLIHLFQRISSAFRTLCAKRAITVVAVPKLHRFELLAAYAFPANWREARHRR